MKPQQEADAAWWRGWWLTALLALPVIYVLGMPPLMALARKWHAPSWILTQMVNVQSPLYRGASHWNWSRRWLNVYSNWWNQKLAVPAVYVEVIREFTYPADWNPTPPIHPRPSTER